jgi:hypothetical protein
VNGLEGIPVEFVRRPHVGLLALAPVEREDEYTVAGIPLAVRVTISAWRL